MQPFGPGNVEKTRTGLGGCEQILVNAAMPPCNGFLPLTHHRRKKSIQLRITLFCLTHSAPFLPNMRKWGHGRRTRA